MAGSTFKITSWDESAFAEHGGTEKLTKATVSQTYSGVIEGDSRGDSVMYYGPDNVPVHYVGIERITGTVDGRSGTFSIQFNGIYTDGVADTTWFVIPGSGTGELTGLRGQGGYRAKGGEPAVEVSFDYEFPEA